MMEDTEHRLTAVEERAKSNSHRLETMAALAQLGLP